MKRKSVLPIPLMYYGMDVETWARQGLGRLGKNRAARQGTPPMGQLGDGIRVARMNSPGPLRSSSRMRRGLAVLLFNGLALLAWRPAAEPVSPVGWFREVVLRASRDTTVSGRRAVDAYWQAQTESQVESLYARLSGGRIAHARLTQGGWQIQGPPAPLVLTGGRTSNDLLLVITNDGPGEREVRISGNDPALHIVPAAQKLPVARSMGIFAQVSTTRAGRFGSALTLEAGGDAASVPVECDARPAGTLAVELFDADGRPTAARVFLTAPDGFNRTPDGAFERTMWMSGEHYFHADRAFQINLPAGEGVIEVVKGFEHLPNRTAFHIDPNTTTRLRVGLKRMENMRALGWYPGDEHIHGNYRGRQFITPAEDLLAARAEDLQVANMMVANSDGAFVHDENFFAGGRAHEVSTAEHILYWNQEMRNRSMYGHLIFQGLGELVRPIYTGFQDTPNWEDWPSNYQQAANAKAQGAFTAYAHPAIKLEAFPSGSDAREAVVDVALGAIDALEVFCSHDEASMRMWYRFLNCGFPVGISAGSDAFVNQSFSFLPGGERVYVHTGRTFSQASWMDGLRQGRAFGTVGPLLFLEVEERLPGERFQFDRGPVRLRVSARAVSAVPMTRLEIVSNGKVLEASAAKSGADRLNWSGTITLDQSAWLAARVWGPEHRLIANGPSRGAERSSPEVLLAHTGASWVTIGGRRVVSPEDRDYLIRWLDALAQDLDAHGHFSGTERKEIVKGHFRRARHIYAALE